jgi:predicted amidohydrolase YtcJ
MLVDHGGFDSAQHLSPLGERLTFAGVKWFVDGAIGGRTALLDEPYVGTDDHGIEVLPPAESEAIARRVHASGGRVAVHANGDCAIRGLLDAFERVAAELGPLRRPRVEHCTLIDDAIVARLHALGAVVLPFAAYTRMYGRKLVDWYGEDRVARMFAHRTFLDRGVHVAASTDHPVAPVEPLNAMQALVTRAGRDDGAVVGAAQRISIEEALRLYTRGAAYAEESEHERGRIAPGYRADLVVLDRDPRELPPQEIASLAVGATIVGGEPVWTAPGVDLV